MNLEKVWDAVVSGSLMEPRPYQSRIAVKVTQMYRGEFKKLDGTAEDNITSVMIESPTGSGKTVIALGAAKLQQNLLAERGIKLYVGWVAMRRNLLAQAERENGPPVTVMEDGEERVYGKNIKVKDIHYVSMFDKKPEELVEASRRRDAGEKIKILMNIDEAQHDAASSCMHLHNIIKPDYITGLSATPWRSDRMKLCFNKVIKDSGIHALIQDGYLSHYDHYTIPEWTPECVFERYMAEPERWGRSAFYFKDLTYCYKLARLFKKVGLTHHVVTGTTDVEEQLRDFRSGAVPRLINCMKLTEGWDEPALQTAFVRDSGKSCTMQMAGRAFRIHKKIHRKNIVQSRHTKWPLIRTAMPVQQYVWQEDSWRSLTVNPALDLINQNTRVAIAMAPVTMPEFLTRQAGKTQKKMRF